MSRHFDQAAYWDRRYREGRDSGEGSRGVVGQRKARYVNDKVTEHGIVSLADWGCGDGQVLRHLTPHVNYVGIDVSQTIIDRLGLEFPDREFILADDATDIEVELGLSMDVLFHFPDDDKYHAYLDRLFGTASRMVIIYSTNHATGLTARHVNRRRFTPDVRLLHPGWGLVEWPVSETVAGFYVYTPRSDA
jgi:SAM-dependent methyltransferase